MIDSIDMNHNLHNYGKKNLGETYWNWHFVWIDPIDKSIVFGFCWIPFEHDVMLHGIAQ